MVRLELSLPESMIGTVRFPHSGTGNFSVFVASATKMPGGGDEAAGSGVYAGAANGAGGRDQPLQTAISTKTQADDSMSNFRSLL